MRVDLSHGGFLFTFSASLGGQIITDGCHEFSLRSFSFLSRFSGDNLLGISDRDSRVRVSATKY